MFSRVARYRIPEEHLDDAVRAFEQAVIELREIDGNDGGYLLVDRENSTAITVTLWRDRASLEASEVRASKLRADAVSPYGGEILAVDRCEVALDFSERTSV
ncbi:MAG TPA: antibiotic biosynthesis monooxygenase family protein [Gaiellaceae bacterium]|jgi:heme-degrading monooxygenase HmoA